MESDKPSFSVGNKNIFEAFKYFSTFESKPANWTISSSPSLFDKSSRYLLSSPSPKITAFILKPSFFNLETISKNTSILLRGINSAIVIRSYLFSEGSGKNLLVSIVLDNISIFSLSMPLDIRKSLVFDPVTVIKSLVLAIRRSIFSKKESFFLNLFNNTLFP